MYIHVGVNPTVLSRGRRLERKPRHRYFQFRAIVSPWLRATKQLAIRFDGTFSTFNSHGELACRANTHGDWKGAGRGDGHSFPLLSSSPLPLLSTRIERVRIQMRRNDHDIQESCCTLLVEDRESLCFPRSESLSDISIAKARRTFRLSRDLHVPLIYPRLLDSPLKTLFPSWK